MKKSAADVMILNKENLFSGLTIKISDCVWKPNDEFLEQWVEPLIEFLPQLTLQKLKSKAMTLMTQMALTIYKL